MRFRYHRYDLKTAARRINYIEFNDRLGLDVCRHMPEGAAVQTRVLFSPRLGAIIAGIQTVHMIRKGQLGGVKD